MKIFIMRHGEAEDFSVTAPVEDHQRELSSLGEKESLVMANWLKNNDINPTQVFVSPYVRAQQTSNIATAQLSSPISTLDIITPLDEAKDVHDFIDGWYSEKSEQCSDENNQDELSLLIISHMPLVSFLVGELTLFTSAPIFSPAAIAHIDYDTVNMQGKLIELITPRDLGLFT